MKIKPTSHWIAWLLVLAFAIATWKTAVRPPATKFAVGVPVSQATQRPLADIQKPATLRNKPQQRSADGSFVFDAQFVSATPGQAVHAASMVELSTGDLRAVWFSGSREGAKNVTVQTAVMDATTLQWGAENTLFERHQIERSLWRYVKKIGNPVISRAPDGSIWLWMVNVSLGGWAGSSISWSRSTDEGVSWSQPRRLVTSPFLNISTLVKGAPVMLADGHVGLPVYHEFVVKFGEILRIDSLGRVVDKVRITGSQTSLQPVVLVTDSENAQVYMRSGTASALMMSTTQDAGKTWSPTRATTWSNPDASLASVVTHTGSKWLALNPTTNHREVLALIQADKDTSFEGALPWIAESSAAPYTRLSVQSYERLLEHELNASGASREQVSAYVASAKRQLCGQQTCSQEFSYPYLIQSRDGYIHLIYTWHRARIKHIRLDPLQPLSAAQPIRTHAPSTH